MTGQELACTKNVHNTFIDLAAKGIHDPDFSPLMRVGPQGVWKGKGVGGTSPAFAVCPSNLHSRIRYQNQIR